LHFFKDDARAACFSFGVNAPKCCRAEASRRSGPCWRNVFFPTDNVLVGPSNKIWFKTLMQDFESDFRDFRKPDRSATLHSASWLHAVVRAAGYEPSRSLPQEQRVIHICICINSTFLLILLKHAREHLSPTAGALGAWQRQ
jgi:hypothetical protein